MKIEIRQKPFNPYQEIEKYQECTKFHGGVGATASFIGTMRDFNQQQKVNGMILEYYPKMTEKYINHVCIEAMQKWSLLDVLVIHSVGKIKISDVIVLIVVWSSHRGDAMDACRYILEELKSKAPFWKKEQLADGDRWVERNSSGYVENKL